jgi:hypothetical protein
MRRRKTGYKSAHANGPGSDAEAWVTIAEAEDHPAARTAARTWFAARGVSIYPTPGRKSMGIIGVRDDDIRVDLLCGRDVGPSTTRISVRSSALDAVTADRATQPEH